MDVLRDLISETLGHKNLSKEVLRLRIVSDSRHDTGVLHEVGDSSLPVCHNSIGVFFERESLINSGTDLLSVLSKPLHLPNTPPNKGESSKP